MIQTERKTPEFEAKNMISFETKLFSLKSHSILVEWRLIHIKEKTLACPTPTTIMEKIYSQGSFYFVQLRRTGIKVLVQAKQQDVAF